MGLSHSLSCNFILHNTFDLTLSRSLHNADLRDGKQRTKHLDLEISQLRIAIGLSKIEGPLSSEKFEHNINTAKQQVKEVEMLFTRELS